MTIADLIAEAWDRRALLLAFVLAFAIAVAKREAEHIANLEAQLAMKPKIETKFLERIVKGPVKIVERIVTTPGKDRIVERTIERQGETIAKDSEHTETPICPTPENPNRWIAGVSWDPALGPTKLPILRGGYSWGNWLDLTVGYQAQGQRFLIEPALRF